MFDMIMFVGLLSVSGWVNISVSVLIWAIFKESLDDKNWLNTVVFGFLLLCLPVIYLVVFFLPLLLMYCWNVIITGQF